MSQKHQTDESNDRRIRTASINANKVRHFDELLALAKQYAGECGECDGTGLVTIYNHDGHGSDADDQPCPECADIRALIAKVES